jgi:hypothetical protein
MAEGMLKEELREWKQHPVTQHFLSLIQQSRQETMEAWANKAYVGETAEATLAANTAALGGMQVLDQVIELIDSMGSEEA